MAYSATTKPANLFGLMVAIGAVAPLSAQAATNQPLDRYKGNINQPVQQEYYRPWFTTGIRWEPYAGSGTPETARRVRCAVVVSGPNGIRPGG